MNQLNHEELLWRNTWSNKVDPKQKQRWDRVVDQVVDWILGNDAPEGSIIPPRETLTLASRVALRVRDLGWDAPTSVSIDRDNFVVFEKRSGPYVQMLKTGIDLITLETNKGAELLSAERLELNTLGRDVC